MYVVPNIMIMYALVFILKIMLWIVLFLYVVVRCNKQFIIGHSDMEKHWGNDVYSKHSIFIMIIQQVKVVFQAK